ncbi:tRNA (adenosine(37)-N6)-dimethylallyltransferase MiaA [Lentilactobacillus senioris]|uniref:tRNA (adenosine(37)-N6)-dimethylallyltransferase MiaA n=1 Tax=Lentilactobacillus senioris TaxID=931534 RepID=UPI002281AC98|nr:tRNA (adenosine(37)-N6)-dimethylallyltransferase MiaA [Lentilactobacillus senioris]MCY9806922.1 tRNA (adenosine(37)-N6)-dimethylallyltransferase MiaA [Lentilactobacillus senioris]
MQKIIVIVGPTAVGKTNLSIKLAQKFNGEIISGDSMQVYRHLDIGTAKILPNEQQGIPHHLINIKNVNERYSVADFVTDAQNTIADIISRDKLPIIVGGTGFYISALLNGLQLGGDYDFDSQLRTELLDIAEQQGKIALLSRLQKVDSLAAAQIDTANTSRIIRAIEVKEKTGHSILEQTNHVPEIDPYVITLTTERAVLYDRINTRVEQMMTAGLLKEAHWLFDQGGESLPAGKGIGYREFNPYFNGNSTLENAVAEVKKDSRHYAKRQLTWFRNKTKVNGWYDLVAQPAELTKIETDVANWLLTKN